VKPPISDPMLEAAIWGSRVFDHRYSLLNHCIHLLPPDAIIHEYGVNDGDSLRYIAGQAPRALITGFDSCEGLPEEWQRGNGWVTPKGSYANDASKIGLPHGVEFVPGWFEDTLPKYVAESKASGRPSPELMHIDCDIYSSTVTILETFKPVMKVGTIIVFDELMDFRIPVKYTAWREHEWRALMESGIKVEPIARTTREQVAVRVLSV
jgi:hypothetical protein